MGFGVRYTKQVHDLDIQEAAALAIDSILADATRQAKEPPPVGAPVDTGTLRNAILYRVEQTHGSVTGVFGVFDPNVHYAIYQELGTRYIRPKLFLRRAFERYAGEFPRRLSALME